MTSDPLKISTQIQIVYTGFQSQTITQTLHSDIHVKRVVQPWQRYWHVGYLILKVKRHDWQLTPACN